MIRNIVHQYNLPSSLVLGVRIFSHFLRFYHAFNTILLYMQVQTGTRVSGDNFGIILVMAQR